MFYLYKFYLFMIDTFSFTILQTEVDKFKTLNDWLFFKFVVDPRLKRCDKMFNVFCKYFFASYVYLADFASSLLTGAC